MKSDAEYKELSIREFTKAAEVYDSGHAGIYEMRKHTVRGKLFAATVGKNANNRLAVFAW